MPTRDLDSLVLRRATLADETGLHQLFRRARGSLTAAQTAEISARISSGYFLVLEDADLRLVGAVHIRVAGKTGYISLLTMDREVRSHRLATRLLGNADLLCAALGCVPEERLDHLAA